MRILIMGSGAVGGYFGAVLSRGGEDVTFVARGAHREEIEARGLRVHSVTSGDFTIRPPAVERPDGSWKADLVLFCVKGYDSNAAIELIAPAVGESTSLLTLQNGIGSGDQLRAAFGAEKVLLGVTYIDATRTGPGVVEETGGQTCNIIFGEADGRVTERAVAVRDTLAAAEIDVVLSENVAKEQWDKLIYICGLSGMMCISRGSMAEVMDTPETREITRLVVQEAASVGRAAGVDLDEDVAETTLDNLDARKHVSGSSMFTDLTRGNPLEVGVLNGAVARIGKGLGVSTPANEFITSCLAVAHNRAMAARG